MAGQSINKNFFNIPQSMEKPQPPNKKKPGKLKKGVIAHLSDLSSDNFFDVDLMKPSIEFKTKIVYPNKEMKLNKFDDLIQK